LSLLLFKGVIKYMPSDPTVTGAWDIAASRNLGIPFNYIWDKPNSHWRPMGLGDLGSFRDRLSATADSHEFKYGSNPNVPNSVSVNSPETVGDYKIFLVMTENLVKPVIRLKSYKYCSIFSILQCGYIKIQSN